MFKPYQGICGGCGEHKLLICTDGLRGHCSGKCCSDYQAILDHDPIKLQDERERRAEEAEFNEENNWWNHQMQQDEGLL